MKKVIYMALIGAVLTFSGPVFAERIEMKMVENAAIEAARISQSASECVRIRNNSRKHFSKIEICREAANNVKYFNEQVAAFNKSIKVAKEENLSQLEKGNLKIYRSMVKMAVDRMQRMADISK